MRFAAQLFATAQPFARAAHCFRGCACAANGRDVCHSSAHDVQQLVATAQYPAIVKGVFRCAERGGVDILPFIFRDLSSALLRGMKAAQLDAAPDSA